VNLGIIGHQEGENNYIRNITSLFIILDTGNRTQLEFFIDTYLHSWYLISEEIRLWDNQDIGE